VLWAREMSCYNSSEDEAFGINGQYVCYGWEGGWAWILFLGLAGEVSGIEGFNFADYRGSRGFQIE